MISDTEASCLIEMGRWRMEITDLVQGRGYRSCERVIDLRMDTGMPDMDLATEY